MNRLKEILFLKVIRKLFSTYITALVLLGDFVLISKWTILNKDKTTTTTTATRGLHTEYLTLFRPGLGWIFSDREGERKGYIVSPKIFLLVYRWLGDGVVSRDNYVIMFKNSRHLRFLDFRKTSENH